MSLDAVQVLAPGRSTTSTLNPQAFAMLGTRVRVPTEAIWTSATAKLSAQAPAGDICELRLVQAAGTIASVATQPLLWTAGSQTTIASVAGAAAVSATVAGFALIGATGATGVTSGDIFWVCISGPVVATCAAGGFIAGTQLAQAAGPGLDDATVTYATVLAESIAAGVAGTVLVRAHLAQ